MLPEILLDIGTVVTIQKKDETLSVMIIGKRQVKEVETFGQAYHRAFDYKAVQYPDGYTPLGGYVYFNHYEILEVIDERVKTDEQIQKAGADGASKGL